MPFQRMLPTAATPYSQEVRIGGYEIDMLEWYNDSR